MKNRKGKTGDNKLFHLSRKTELIFYAITLNSSYVYIVSDLLLTDAKTKPDKASVYTANDEITSILQTKQPCDAPQFEVAPMACRISFCVAFLLV